MKTNKDLIGNLIIYIADYCKTHSTPLYHTKLLKLMYFIDEESVRETGVPITWLDYEVWQKGTVSSEVYFSKLSGTNKFDKYVDFVERSNKYLVVKKKPFDDLAFSEMDLIIINKVLDNYGRKNSDELIQILHKDGSLWSEKVLEYNIRFTGSNHTSNVMIDFGQLIADDKFKQFNY